MGRKTVLHILCWGVALGGAALFMVWRPLGIAVFLLGLIGAAATSGLGGGAAAGGDAIDGD
jgi:hypothetical protein